jgi:hypothetical protein
MVDSTERKHPKSGIFECEESNSPIPNECERTRLIGEISKLLREPLMPESTRTAGLTLIGWLARRMPGETAHALGVAEARAAGAVSGAVRECRDAEREAIRQARGRKAR